MTMVDTMRNRLKKYLTGACSLDEFQEWFAPALRDAAVAEDAEAEELAASIALAFFLRGSGSCTAQDLREVLEQLAQPSAFVSGKVMVAGAGAIYYPAWSGTASFTLAV